ncbi:hypothetical protein [Pontimicrobium sp. MEBiC01747]
MKLEDILELEEKQLYNEAYHSYNILLNEKKQDFKLWKHYYFFLWYMLDVVDGQFTIDINLRRTLVIEFKKGLKLFKNIPEFNFITGYTISIMPYIFGNCNKYEKKGIQLLEKANHLEPNNSIYKMTLLGAQWDFGGQERSYNEVCIKSKQEILKKYKGKGLIDSYFSRTLNRYEEVLK